MPRVTQHTASNRGKTYTCARCGQPVEPGQRYFMWTRRIGPKSGYRQHLTCGFPRPTQLSSRKTAAIEEAVQDYSAPDVDLEPLDKADHTTDSVELDAGAWESAVDGVISQAEEVADEYESGADNMPDSLQSSPTYEAMQDVAQRLRDWAEELRDKASDPITVDIVPPEGDELDEEWREQAEQAIQDAWDERGSEIDDLMGELPEYEG